MIKYKSATVLLSFSAEQFDHSSSPTYKNLPIPNQLHFWTEHVQSIVKVKNELKSRQNSKVGWQSLFSNSVGQTVCLNGLFRFLKNTYPQYND